MKLVAKKVDAFNSTLAKLKELKAYDKEHVVLPKANLTLVKPELKLQFLKPTKTALKVRMRDGDGWKGA